MEGIEELSVGTIIQKLMEMIQSFLSGYVMDLLFKVIDRFRSEN